MKLKYLDEYYISRDVWKHAEFIPEIVLKIANAYLYTHDEFEEQCWLSVGFSPKLRWFVSTCAAYDDPKLLWSELSPGDVPFGKDAGEELVKELEAKS